jgi:uncharacterized protein YdeI (YjbR/CyaY-like superfamily)
MEIKQGLPILVFENEARFEAWLCAHHATCKGLWLKIAKKGTAAGALTHAQALEAALCHGWIDGQKASFNERFWLQRFGPRGPRSRWSKINCEKALNLIKAKRMQPAGLAAIEAARNDGRWESAYEPQSRAEVPEDLKAELDRNPAAAAFFANLDSHNRYAILYRLGSAKRPETRLRRLAQFVDMLNRNERIYP